ncbi:MAG: radical SAM-associated putative lipoprotein [Bacteroidales bacterium]|nr:radical SAM-associated putative lipoprotein [Bacteroidales bacterium]
MKKEKSISKSKKLLNRLMVYLIGLLGFTAATGCPVFAYGSPHATYKYKFQLLDEKGKPLENTQLRISKKWKDYYYLMPIYDKMKTDKNGKINYSVGGSIESYKDSWLVYYPTDNEHHAGVFKEDSVRIEEKQIKKGKGTWNDGTFEVKATLKLKKK